MKLFKGNFFREVKNIWGENFFRQRYNLPCPSGEDWEEIGNIQIPRKIRISEWEDYGIPKDNERVIRIKDVNYAWFRHDNYTYYCHYVTSSVP